MRPRLIPYECEHEKVDPLWYHGAAELDSKVSKSLLHPFMFKDYRGLTINPYQGCQHRCAYCYATYQWSPEFYDKIYAKSNAPEVLEDELASWKDETIKPVMVSSATDCYQAAELRFGLSRRCIEVLQKYNVPYYVFTKSALIARDFELHMRFRDKCLIIWSITTCNETVRRVIEPGTPPAEKLFSTIKKFSDAGIHCAVNVDPIIPLITDSRKELESLVQMCGAAGVENVFGSVMRLRSDIWERMKLVFNLLDVPDAVSRYCDIYGIREPLASNYVSATREYAAEILTFLARRVSENLMSSGFPHLLTPLPVNRAALGQTTLAAYS